MIMYIFIEVQKQQPYNGLKIILLIKYIYDLFRFIVVMFNIRYKLIILNTSLGWVGLKRDALYLKLSKLRGKRVIVFFR